MNRRGRSAALVPGLLLAWAATAWSQATISVSRATGEVGADFDGWRVGYPLSPAQSLLMFREWVDLRLAGAVVSEQVLAFHAGLRPMQTQLSWSGPAELADGRGDRFDFGLGVRAFAGRPVSLSAAHRRTSGSVPGPMGSTVDDRRTEAGSRLEWRNPYLPVAFSFDDRSFSQTWRLSSQPDLIRQDARTRTLRFDAQNRKTGVVLERFSYDDRAPGGQDFTVGRAGVNHRVRWGKGSSLASALFRTQRTGTSPFQRSSWDETAHLQHTRTVGSDYRLGLLRVETPLGATRARAGDVAVAAQVRPLLLLGIRARTQSTEYAAGRQRYSRAGPEGRYTTALPYGVRLTVSGSVALERVDQNPGSGGRVPVVNERHVVDPSGRFRLENANADAASVVLTDATETLIYQEGIDYRLVDIQALLEVVLLPGGRIAVGDTVLVDYVFLVLRAGSVDAVALTYDAGVHLGGLEVYHRRARRDQRAGGGGGLTGGGSLAGLGSVIDIGDRDERTTGVRLRRETALGAVELRGEHATLRYGDFAFSADRVNGGLTMTLRPDLRGLMRGTWSSTEDGAIRSRLGSLSSTAEWAPTPGLRLRATAAAWWWRERGGLPGRSVRQSFVGGGLEASWQIRLLRVQARYDLDTWTETFARTQHRLVVGLARSF